MILYVLAGAVFAGDFLEVVKVVDDIRKQNNISGLSLVVVNSQGSLHKVYLGLADREKQKAVNSKTVFRIGSITKTFTSLAILRLVEQGKLSLDDEVSTHITELPFQNNFEVSPIRVAYLLEHTAGFRGLTKKEFDFKELNWSISDSLAYDPTSRITAWPPGTYPSYTNSGAGLAALVIEEVSQQTFEVFVDDQIFKPLGFTDATFFLDDKINSRLAKGYDLDGETPIPYWHMLYRSFGGINMRVSEMAALVRMLINKGQVNNKEIFSKASIRRMETPTTSLAARHGLTYGYGLGNYQWLRKGVLFYGHGGDADGYLAHYGYTRENNMGYFVVINAFNNQALRKIRAQIENWIVSDIQQAPFPNVNTLTSKEVSNIVGTYETIAERFPWMNQNKDSNKELRIFARQGKFFTQLESNVVKQLISVNAQHFRRLNQPIATISIVKDDNGTPVLQGDMGNFRKIK